MVAGPSDGRSRTCRRRAASLNNLADACAIVLREATRRGHAVALVGGFAVSVRTEPRFTRDVDLVVAVDSDRDAEQLVAALLADGHSLLATVEQEAVDRLATARIRLIDGQLVDLLFASSGIEREIAEAAEDLEVLPGLRLPVITTGHLIAVKLLARDDVTRPQDIADLRALLKTASPEDLDLAEQAVTLIMERGFGRGRDLNQDLADLC